MLLVHVNYVLKPELTLCSLCRKETVVFTPLFLLFHDQGNLLK